MLYNNCFPQIMELPPLATRLLLSILELIEVLGHHRAPRFFRNRITLPKCKLLQVYFHRRAIAL